MGTRDEVGGGRRRTSSSPAAVGAGGEDRVTVEVREDLAVSEEPDGERDQAVAGDEDDGAADTSGSAAGAAAADDGEADTSGFAAAAGDAAGAADGDREPDAPLGLTAVRLPARGRRRGRPGTIF